MSRNWRMPPHRQILDQRGPGRPGRHERSPRSPGRPRESGRRPGGRRLGVLAAQPVVPDPGRLRNIGIEAQAVPQLAVAELSATGCLTCFSCARPLMSLQNLNSTSATPPYQYRRKVRLRAIHRPPSSLRPSSPSAHPVAPDMHNAGHVSAICAPTPCHRLRGGHGHRPRTGQALLQRSVRLAVQRLRAGVRRHPEPGR